MKIRITDTMSRATNLPEVNNPHQLMRALAIARLHYFSNAPKFANFGWGELQVRPRIPGGHRWMPISRYPVGIAPNWIAVRLQQGRPTLICEDREVDRSPLEEAEAIWGRACETLAQCELLRTAIDGISAVIDGRAPAPEHGDDSDDWEWDEEKDDFTLKPLKPRGI